jgi:DNA-binding transcriptional regulator of glucitol operon
VLRRYRFALRPGWIFGHLLVAAAVVTMILLGRWQLHVSEQKHFSVQNTGYTIQWWLFSGFALFFWWRILRDAATHRAASADETHATPAESAAEPHSAVAYRRYVMPTGQQPSDDPEVAAYNQYLAKLAAKDAEDAQ